MFDIAKLMKHRRSEIYEILSGDNLFEKTQSSQVDQEKYLDKEIFQIAQSQKNLVKLRRR